MAEETAQERIVRESFEDMNVGRGDRLKGRISDDFEMYTRITSVTGTPYRGAAGIDEWFADIAEQFSTFVLKPREIEQRGPDRVFAYAILEMTGKGSELPWREDAFYAIFFDDDRAVRLRISPEREEAERMVARDE